MILLERLLKRVHKKVFILIFVLMVQFSFAGLLDSIIKTPPILSLEDSKKIQEEFEERIDEFCYLPGSVVYFDSDSTCFSPVQAQINNYIQYFDEHRDLENPDYGLDTLYHFRYRVAMYTYNKFSSTKKRVNKIFDFSHNTFLEYLEEDEEIKEKPWLVKVVEKIFNFIDKYILQPFYRFVVNPIVKLSFFWKAILFVIAIAVFIFVVVIVGRFAARLYPSVELSRGRRKTERGKNIPVEINWLQKAREKIDESSLADASECIYRHLITWSLNRNRIRRYEWWTNRQFLNVMRKRFIEDCKTAEEIITMYEYVIFGHSAVDKKHLEQLIIKADLLKGKKSS